MATYLPDIDERFEMREGEIIPVRLVFIDWLEGAYITSASWDIADLTVSGVAHTQTSTRAMIEGGSAGQEYEGTVTVETDEGATLKAKVLIEVVD